MPRLWRPSLDLFEPDSADAVVREAYTRRVLNHATHHADARVTESPPCDGCSLAARCAIERLACAAFSMYLADEPAVRWRLAPECRRPCGMRRWA